MATTAQPTPAVHLRHPDVARRRGWVVPTYSLVVPAYNEEGVIKELAARLTDVMDRLDGDAEAILVDDGSRDRTWARMVEAARHEPRLRLLRLSRNFGHQIALTAGVDVATGDAVIVMDADLQDPPEVVLELSLSIFRWFRWSSLKPHNAVDAVAGCILTNGKLPRKVLRDFFF